MFRAAVSSRRVISRSTQFLRWERIQGLHLRTTAIAVLINFSVFKSSAASIKYTVREEPIKNYNVAVSGSEDTGYVINNTLTGQLTIPVTEICQGGSRKKIKVHLLADGKKKYRKTLCKKNRWQTTFKKLPQYAKKEVTSSWN